MRQGLVVDCCDGCQLGDDEINSGELLSERELKTEKIGFPGHF